MNRIIILFFYLLTLAVAVVTLIALLDRRLEPVTGIIAFLGCGFALGAIRAAAKNEW